MNVNICQHCKLKPCLTSHYTVSGTMEHKIFCVTVNDDNWINVKYATNTAVIDQDMFGVLIDNLREKYFAHTINPLNLDKLKNNGKAECIEVNRNCSCWMEHQMYDWNVKHG